MLGKSAHRSARALLRAAMAGLALYGVLVLLVFYTRLPDLLIAPLRVAPVERDAAAIVVLAAWASREGVLNEPALRRVHAAARLFRAGRAPLVIVSGGDPGGGHLTADHMAGFAVELGVPRGAMLVEGASRNTVESARNVAALCRQRALTPVLLVTSAVHMRRAQAALRLARLDVYPVPADPWSLDWESPAVRLEKFWDALAEYAALAYYRWHGWV